MSVTARTAGVSNPFPGLLSYTKSSAWKLFGRNADASLMITRILSGRTTLLFAGTGVGKTSFLDAKLAPNCESRFAIVSHRTWAGDTPLALLKKTICSVLNGHGEPSGDVPQLLARMAAVQKRPVLLILDQFEEIFQHHRDTTALRDFKDVLVNLINDTTQDLRLILSMREEFLGELSMFENSIPDPFYNYYHLKNLSEAQASEVIEATTSTVKTAAGTPVECDLPSLESLIKDLRKIPGEPKGESSGLERDFVPPPYLQIVCHRLWSRTKPDETGQPFLAEYRSGTATEEFHAYCQEKLEMPENEKEIVAEAFGFLMSRSGAKMAYELGDLARLLRVDPAPLASALGRLSDPEVRILRSFPDPEKKPWFELYHDMYAPFLMNWKAEQDAAKRKRLQELELQAEEQRKQLEQQKELDRQRQEELQKEREFKIKQAEELRKRKRDLLVNRMITSAAAVFIFVLWYGINPMREARTMKEATAEFADRSIQASIDPVKVKQAYESLNKDSFLLATLSPSFRPKLLWSHYWNARADAEGREENRDAALLFGLKMLAEVPSASDDMRKWRAKMLIGGSYSRLMHSYAVDSRTAPGHNPLARITPDGTLVAVYEDGTVRRWNTANGETLPSFTLQVERSDNPNHAGDAEPTHGAEPGRMRLLGISPLGDYVAVLALGNPLAPDRGAIAAGNRARTPSNVTIVVFDLKSGKEAFRPVQLKVAATSIRSAVLAPGGGALAVLGSSQIQLCWLEGLANGMRGDTECRPIRPPEDSYAAAFSIDGTQLAVSSSQMIMLWSADKGGEHKLLQTRHMPIVANRDDATFIRYLLSLAYLDNGFLAVANGLRLRVWDIRGNIVQDFQLPVYAQYPVLRKAGNSVIMTGTDRNFYECDLTTGKIQILGAIDPAPGAVAFAPDAESFISYQPDYGFRQWQVQGGSFPPANVRQLEYQGQEVIISPDANYVAMLGQPPSPSTMFGARAQTGAGLDLTVYSLTSHTAILHTRVAGDVDFLGESVAFAGQGILIDDGGASFRRLSFDGKEQQVIPKSSQSESIIPNNPSPAYLASSFLSTCRVWDNNTNSFRPVLNHCKYLVFRSDDEIGIFDPASGLTVQHWDGQSWRKKETIPIPHGDDISSLTFGPGIDMVTVSQGKWIIVYWIDAYRKAVPIATWRYKNSGSPGLFQMGPTGDALVIGRSWVHRLSQSEAHSLTSVDIPDTNIFPGTTRFSYANNRIKMLRTLGKSLVLQEVDISMTPEPDDHKTDWAAQFLIWQQKLGYSVADNGTLVPQGAHPASK